MVKILIVDDDLVLLEEWSDILERLTDYEITACNTFEEGRAKLDQEEFDILIVDIFFKTDYYNVSAGGLGIIGKIGLDNTMKSLNNEKQIHMIAVSGSHKKLKTAASADNFELSKRLGAKYALKKPFDPLKLVYLIDEIITDHPDDFKDK